jgi:hypothetical protein
VFEYDNSVWIDYHLLIIKLVQVRVNRDVSLESFLNRQAIRLLSYLNDQLCIGSRRISFGSVEDFNGLWSNHTQIIRFHLMILPLVIQMKTRSYHYSMTQWLTIRTRIHITCCCVCYLTVESWSRFCIIWISINWSHLRIVLVDVKLVMLARRKIVVWLLQSSSLYCMFKNYYGCLNFSKFTEGIW